MEQINSVSTEASALIIKSVHSLEMKDNRLRVQFVLKGTDDFLIMESDLIGSPEMNFTQESFDLCDVRGVTHRSRSDMTLECRFNLRSTLNFASCPSKSNYRDLSDEWKTIMFGEGVK